MELGRQVIFVALLAVVSSLLPVAESRSIKNAMRHKIKKRSLYEETCPPPYVIEITQNCTDSCLDDDYCVGNQMCCFDGCSYVCMDPVPSEAVIDWVDDNEGSTAGLEELIKVEIEVVTPVIEELVCYYHGMTLNDGERIPLGCKICSCFNGNLMCDVANCNKEYQARLALELSGSGFGDDDEDDKETKGEGSGNDKWPPIIDGLEHKEDFIPFEEFKEKENLNGVEMKEDFIPFGKDHSAKEQSGNGEKGSGDDSRENFIPFDEENNNENSGDDVASLARLRRL